MKRLLAYTAAGLLLGLAPAVAQTEPPDSQPTEPSAQPSGPPADQSQPPPNETEQPTQLTPPKTEAQPPAMPDQSAATPSQTAQFLTDQKSSDWLATELIGTSVVNASNETIGEISDLLTDQSGKLTGVLIGVGGLLGIGEKDVAVRFEDLKIAREEDNDLNVMTNLSKDQLNSAPDFRTLKEPAAGSEQTNGR